jgi:tetratricopeptide (TPR) repeat protein
MESAQLFLLSTYLKKWSFNDHRITLNYSFSSDFGYVRNRIEMRTGVPANMVNEFLNGVFHTAKEKLREYNEQNDVENAANANNINLVNEAEVKRKMHAFLSKINREFNHNKKMRGRTKMITTRSLDFYYNDFEFEPLDDHIKFYVHLNRGVNKINGDLWTNAVDDFRLALAIDGEDVMANKYMAEALNKLGRYDDAIDHLKVYSEAENTPESLTSLAAAYIQLNNYKKAEQIFKKIAKEFPESLLAHFGQAQVAYKQGKKYLKLLEKIYESEPVWLKDKLKKEWDYKLPEYAESEDTMWNAAIAARYLGLERPFDLTRKAFNDEIPSYFDSERGTIRFVKKELDAWVEIMNHFELDSEEYKVYEDRLTPEELQKAEITIPKRTTRKTKKNDQIEEDLVQ